MEQFSDLEDFNVYVRKHFEKADNESPLESGEAREEIMFTDYEGFSSAFYSESFDSKLIERLIEFLNMDDDSRIKVGLHLEEYGDVEEAFENYDDIYYYDKPENAYDLFEELNPEQEEEIEQLQISINHNGMYLMMDYNAWMNDNFT